MLHRFISNLFGVPLADEEKRVGRTSKSLPAPPRASHSCLGFAVEDGTCQARARQSSQLRGRLHEVANDTWTSFAAREPPAPIWVAVLPEEPLEQTVWSQLEIRLVLITEEPKEALPRGLLEKVETGYLYNANEDCPYYAALRHLSAEGWRRCDEDPCLWFLPVSADVIEEVIAKCFDSPHFLAGGFEEPQLHVRADLGCWNGVRCCRLDIRRLQEPARLVSLNVASTEQGLGITCTALAGNVLLECALEYLCPEPDALNLGQLLGILEQRLAQDGSKVQLILPDGTLVTKDDATPLRHLAQPLESRAPHVEIIST